VAKQTELFDVVFRCDPCDRRHGHAPVLAAADEGAAGGWSFWVADRGGIRGRAVAVREAPDALARLYGTEPSTRLGFLPLTAAAAHLACRRCPHRPRLATARLIELAEQAVADGRQEVFV
jgi:hypothetical protein